MGRLRLTSGFCRAAQRFARRDRKDLGRTLATLVGDWPALPRPGDRRMLLPPVQRCLARRVGGTSLWVYFEVRGDEVWAIAVGPAVEE